MGNCAKYEKDQLLGKPVEKPCGKPVPDGDGFPPHAPPFQENLSFLGPVVDALTDAVGNLAARVDSLELLFDQFVSILDQPLSPTESLERLRQLREQL